MGLKFPRHSWLFSLSLHCYALLCCTQMWESAACLWVDCIANKSERWPVMLTLGNADAPAGKISRVGNHRHVTHTLIDCIDCSMETLIDCSTLFIGQEQDQNKEEKTPTVISSKSSPVVVHALALAVFHRWVTCSLPAISKYHFLSKVTYCTFPCTLILVNSLNVICSTQTGLH